VYDAWVVPLMRLGGVSRRPTEPHTGNVFAPSPVGDAATGQWGRHWLRAVGGGAVVTLGGLAIAARAARRPTA
jgi:hypothetical protein